MDRDEFKRTWLPLGGGFFRVAMYILENEDDASDAVQDLYVRLWNSRSGLGGIRNPQAYGVTLLRNMCLDRLRRAKARHTDPMGDGEAVGCAGGVPYGADADSGMISRQTLDRLRTAVAELPDTQRKVLEMRVFDHMEYEDMAAATGLSQVNLRAQLSLARKELKRKLNSDIQ